MADRQELRFAVLVDGDNAQANQIGNILREVVKHGVVTIRRVYGDWTSPELEGWRKQLHQHAIQPMQQFRNTTGKNATDSAMIIDAMDILYTAPVEGFAIVSSDSDYTRLAIRLREAGKFIIGIGRKHTPRPFVDACNEFRFVENMAPQKSMRPVSAPRPDAKQPAKAGNGAPPPAADEDDFVNIVCDAMDMVDQESDWVDLRKIANNVKKLNPSFDPRTYGNMKLSGLIAARTDSFEVRRDNERKRVMVRYKE